MDIRKLDDMPEAEPQVKPKSYPKFIETKVKHIRDQLGRNPSWQGDTEVQVMFTANHTAEFSMSHLGIRKLRAQNFTVQVKGGFKVNSFQQAVAKFDSEDAVSKPRL